MNVGGKVMKFIINSILLGVGLAMDAFSVSIVNGLNECHMSRIKSVAIAGTYAAFQFAMPMIGWFCVYRIAEAFQAFQKFIPWIALLLLLYIGGKMLIEGVRAWGTSRSKDTIATGGTTGETSAADCTREAADPQVLTATTLFFQGVATSIDALSVGFTIANYNAAGAFLASALIAVTTFIICMVGLLCGKCFGDRLADKASILGGVILILIGVEIFVTGI